MAKRSKFTQDILFKNQLYMQEVRKHSEEFLAESGRMPRFFIDTYGCQMNEHDSEKLHGMLMQMGYVQGTDYTDADLVIINTCCVRENAEFKVYGNLGHLKPLKKKNKRLKIAVCGCMMQQPHVVQVLKDKYPQVDIIFGTHNLHTFPQMLLKTFESSSLIVEIWEQESEIIEGLPATRKCGVKAFVNIMYGCNNFCTYCIVPYTRGRERSREPEDILAEVTSLAKEGVKEITLLGQNVNSYGVGLAEKMDFSDLLKVIDQIPGIERIRFMTSHPKDASEKLVQTMAESKHICEHIHLPLQAGSDHLLKKMNRYYTRADYIALVEMFKKYMPNIAITTDIIMGFPGETEDDVEQLITLIEQVRYDSTFTFIYSPRTGTPAAKMEDQIPENLKHERFERVLKILNDIVIEKNQGMKDKIVEVLVEGFIKDSDDTLQGRTRGNVLVNFNGTADDIGKLVMIKITKPRSFSLYGEKCNSVKE